MEKTRGDIRKLLKYEFELGHGAKEATENINRAKGAGTIAYSTAARWISKFKNGDLEIEDEKRSGRPREVDRVAVVNVVEDHPSMTTRMLAEDFDCSHVEIEKILHEAGKKWLKSRWVPKQLTLAQKQKRVQMATQLLQRSRQNPFFEQIITCDEKWIPFVNEERHGEWRSPGQKPGGTPNKDFRATKAMLCVWWDRRGPIHWELLEKGENINSNVYCQQLDRVKRQLRNRRITVSFLQDNAKPHTAKQTFQKIADLGWELLDHPPYSPDLSPSDFYLFRSLEHWLRGKNSEQSMKCDKVSPTSLRPRPGNGIAVELSNWKNSGRNVSKITENTSIINSNLF